MRNHTVHDVTGVSSAQQVPKRGCVPLGKNCDLAAAQQQTQLHPPQERLACATTGPGTTGTIPAFSLRRRSAQIARTLRFTPTSVRASYTPEFTPSGAHRDPYFRSRHRSSDAPAP
jgi:hypothetical protein